MKSFACASKLQGYFALIALTVSLTLVSAKVEAQSRWGGEQAALVITQPLGFERKLTRVDVVGFAEAVRSVDLYAAVAERVDAVLFKPGQVVAEGEVLVQLDDRRQQASKQRIELELADAERTVKRLEQSRTQGAVAQSELDAAVTARDLLKVALTEVKIEIEDRKVRAPFAGVVGFTELEPGDRINTSTLITTLDQRDELFVRFNAPETALPLLQNDAELAVSPWNQQAQSYPAVVEQVDSRINQQNRTIAVRARVANSDDSLRPGMSFRVSLVLRGDAFAVIHEAALMWGAEGAYVWINEQGKAKRVNVSIEQRLPGRILVNGELQLGDALVIEGVQQLRPGQSLSVQGE